MSSTTGITLPDVTAPGVFRHAIRFVNTNPKPGEGKYLATYETDWEDVSRAWTVERERLSKLTEQGRNSPLSRGDVLVVAFKRLGGEFHAASRPVRGILAVLLNCKDPARDEEFNRWYSDIHIPDILDTGLYHTAYRYESLDPGATGGKYLAIYETDQSDPGKAGDEVLKLRANWERRGRLLGATEVVFRITARRIWPMD